MGDGEQRVTRPLAYQGGWKATAQRALHVLFWSIHKVQSKRDVSGKLQIRVIFSYSQRTVKTQKEREFTDRSILSQRYSVYTDPYHNIPRLDLYQFDGSPLQPMYLAFSPPQMLPTTTLNQPSATATTTSSSKLKRALDYGMPSMAKTSLEGKRTAEIIHRIDADRLWWVGLTLTGVGGLLYLGPRRLGIQL